MAHFDPKTKNIKKRCFQKDYLGQLYDFMLL